MARTMAREAAFMLLFERELGGGEENTLKDMIAPELGLRIVSEDAQYIGVVVDGTWENRVALDAIIEKTAKNWTAERISRVELSLLRLALYEMLHMEDIPGLVSVNEAVELTKKYAGEEAGSFVNGILGAALQNEAVKP